MLTPGIALELTFPVTETLTGQNRRQRDTGRFGYSRYDCPHGTGPPGPQWLLPSLQRKEP